MQYHQPSHKPPRVVMVETSHPGNIGAAARAMKTMCLYELSLVQPEIFPDASAFARASGAADILENAQCFDDLSSAIADCQQVIAISARPRKVSAPVLAPRQLMQAMLNDMRDLKVAWLFGRERNGLTNQEIDLCHAICTIPANCDYASLNIAAAVQVLSYEWHAAQLENRFSARNDLPQSPALATVKDHEGFYQHLWQALHKIGFLDRQNPLPLQRKLRHLFTRTGLTQADINILRGILKNILKQ